jgi:ribonuclease HI
MVQHKTERLNVRARIETLQRVQELKQKLNKSSDSETVEKAINLLYMVVNTNNGMLENATVKDLRDLLRL